MTFDTHLINVAIAGIGISACVAVLIALAVIGSFAWWKHNKAYDKPVNFFEPVRHEEITQTQLRQAA
ncbi:MAG TPA: hypothetical protein VN767_25340 [Streptosporangiaceae bacterium]|jgi:hypothetical protein|nr:hypothetical protein [Streptosporangiaceae bacterium]